ncbi:hypothetical protein QTI27_23095 [Variovorax sp. J31P216]|nr:hypothetical protein [Variovorax sp. J31P216]
MTSGERLRQRIIAAGVVLVAAFAGSAIYDGWRLHQQIMIAVDVLLRDTG